MRFATFKHPRCKITLKSRFGCVETTLSVEIDTGARYDDLTQNELHLHDVILPP